LAIFVTGLTGLIKPSSSWALPSLVMAMMPICACGLGYFHHDDEYRPWFQLVWLIQAALIFAIFLSPRFRIMAVVAFILTAILAYWLVSWPVHTHLREERPWLQDRAIRQMAWYWAVGLILSVVSATRALIVDMAKEKNNTPPRTP
jgi:hypothetical protein